MTILAKDKLTLTINFVFGFDGDELNSLAHTISTLNHVIEEKRVFGNGWVDVDNKSMTVVVDNPAFINKVQAEIENLPGVFAAYSWDDERLAEQTAQKLFKQVLELGPNARAAFDKAMIRKQTPVATGGTITPLAKPMNQS